MIAMASGGCADPKSLADVWSVVEAWARQGELDDLRAHGLHLFASPRLQADGKWLSPSLESEVRAASIRPLIGSAALEKVVKAVSEPVIVLKGPEVAEYYPDPSLRPYVDIDVLAVDAPAAHRELINAGFVPMGGDPSFYEDVHHLQPLLVPGLPIAVEVHRRPSWPYWALPPTPEEIFSQATPARVGVAGLLAPRPAHHALILAAHSWSELPLRRLLDLVDVAALADCDDRDEIEAIARRWDIAGIWRTTAAALDALFYGRSPTVPLRTWARSLSSAQDATVLETHTRRWVAPFWALPAHRAVMVSAWMLVREVLPAHGEEFGPKLKRIRRALRNAFVARSDHDSKLGADAHRFPRKRR